MNGTSHENPKVYLGDGVYVSTRWGDLKLETDRHGITHWIVLGPDEYAALLAYVAAQQRHAEERTE